MSRVTNRLLRSIKFLIGKRTDCREFGQRAAELIIQGAENLTPRVVKALDREVDRDRIFGAVCCLGRYSFELAIESRSYSMECSLLLVRGANEVFVPAMAHALTMDESTANIAYLKATRAICDGLLQITFQRAAKRHTAQTDAEILTMQLLKIIDEDFLSSSLPSEAVKLFDYFFRSITQATIDSLERTVFMQPKSWREVIH
jgi:hypothetical protein